MNILFVASSMDVGGVETNLVVLSDELTRRGHAVWIASSGGHLVPELGERGIEHLTLPISLRRPHLLAVAAMRLRSMIDQERFAVVHAMSAAANVA
ncbi:MAG TPA: glycosyltransferase, partial [Candidatus Limnocylindria bacterium]|nr:glycosyltransferase [Candidatus Limnocylindria bacterium]